MIPEVRVRIVLPTGIETGVIAGPSGPGIKAFKGSHKAAARTAVLLARLAEPIPDLVHDVRIRTPDASHAVEASGRLGEHLVATAAVVADRAARGLLKLPSDGAIVLAVGVDWCAGVIAAPKEPWFSQGLEMLAKADVGNALVVIGQPASDSTAAIEAFKCRNPQAQIKVTDSLLHFSGNLGDARKPRRFEVLFPVLADSGAEALHALSVVVSPADPRSGGSIDVVGSKYSPFADSRARQVVQSIQGRRDRDEWNTVIHLPAVSFGGGSFELAVAVAYRIARGLEWPGPGRVIATGAIDTQSNPGSVLYVDDSLTSADDSGGLPSRGSKTSLFRRAAQPTDTFLVPKVWETTNPLHFPEFIDADPLQRPQVVYVDHVLPSGQDTDSN